jgi:sulfur-oxidizing protein SoxY
LVRQGKGLITMTRREILRLSILAAIAAGITAPARAASEAAVALLGEGRAPETGPELRFDIPEIAEDGAIVPVEIVAEGAREILLIAPANPEPEILHAGFGPLAPRARLVTRIRLAESQEVLAYARMADGRLLEARVRVAVLAGGCVG